jgi:hypothetical protein
MQQTSSRRVVSSCLRFVEALKSLLLILALATAVRLQETTIEELRVGDRGFWQTDRLRRIYKSKQEHDGEKQKNDCTSNNHL